ncbi:MAG: bifunctional 5,10-methylenetetrahydrofolate dehydrogenase/5,10-methenyltetrahydrofolate cyclohydrolase [Patescibacteria group bacterium]|nr:bifunctional 5,10-methylenetetrahydrofolate dehydrogenase/5,10-methenyltetrahydrofolate cyclohydrolase [Patescibacteria group bacterium]
MIARILDGKEVASHILSRVKKEAKEASLELAVVQVGTHPASVTYIERKKEIALSLGVSFKLYKFPEDILQQELESEVEKIGNTSSTTGMIVQLPLPSAFNTEAVLNKIPEEKDVDVLSETAFNKFQKGELSILPPTISAIAEILLHYEIPVQGKTVVIVGRGRLVGLPAQIYFESAGANVIVAHSQTSDLAKTIQQGDIVVSGVGKAGLITGEMVKEGAVVIDAGISVEGGVTTGDIDTESVSEKASYISPVPGGVGPVTVACLFSNLLLLSE